MHRSSIASGVRRLWDADKPLTAVGLVMIGALAASLAGLWLDPRAIAGAPAWLKPAKFAAASAIYSLTLAWLFTWLPAWQRTRRIVGWTTAVVLALEVAIIGVQAWRGTTSHFNTATVLDGALFTIMGAAIVGQTLTSIAVAAALWREHFADEALGWALRLGFSITIVGALSGGLMTRPTDAQLSAARAGQRLAVTGAHTVGAPDGGAGLPGTGWSREHGDLRVPHFVGLHAVQALPLVLLAIGRRHRLAGARVRLMVTGGISYAALFGILLWQALRGQSLVAPDAWTIGVLGAWLAATAIAARIAAGAGARARHAPVVCERA